MFSPLGSGIHYLVEGSENEFPYSQVFLNYKDDFDNLIFKRDDATQHISASNKQLIIDLFEENNFIQNPKNCQIWNIL